MHHLTEANWDEYRKNNHKKIARPDVIAFGAVSFKRHLGKPLSQELWEDLVHRLMINGLCIYGPHDAQWTIGWMEGHCNIHLDKKGNVEDIDFNPYHSHLYRDCYGKEKEGDE